MAMVGIFKLNETSQLGGVTPQGEGVSLVNTIKDWTMVEVDESKISSIQEFSVKYVDDKYKDAVNAPQQPGAYNEPAYKIEGIGDKLRIENNPGQITYGIPGVEDGLKIEHPDVLDNKSQKNFTEEDVKPYKELHNFIKKYDKKCVVRNELKGEICDVEDDIADTKVLAQTILYYFVNEWKDRSEELKNKNKNRVAMDKFAKTLLDDETKMRADLNDGMSKIKKILQKEEKIKKIVEVKYKK
jgi:hypothetical protein